MLPGPGRYRFNRRREARVPVGGWLAALRAAVYTGSTTDAAFSAGTGRFRRATRRASYEKEERCNSVLVFSSCFSWPSGSPSPGRAWRFIVVETHHLIQGKVGKGGVVRIHFHSEEELIRIYEHLSSGGAA